jgi:hypothetical protein
MCILYAHHEMNEDHSSNPTRAVQTETLAWRAIARATRCARIQSPTSRAHATTATKATAARAQVWMALRWHYNVDGGDSYVAAADARI